MLILSKFHHRARTCWFPSVVALAMLAANPATASDLKIERTLLPDATPSSFAIGFSNDVSFCYDVTRGGLSYAWRGGFVDIASVRPDSGKNISPVKLLGELVYRESEYFPLRKGDPQRGEEVTFKGYRIKSDAVEFLYEIGRCRVSEEISPKPDGSGIVRRFRIEGAAPGELWWYVPGEVSLGKVEAGGATREAAGFRFNPAQEFTVEARFEKAAS